MRTTAYFVLGAWAALAPALCQTQESRTFAEVEMQNIRVTGFSTDRVTLSCDIFVRVTERAVLRRFAFSGLKMNGATVFADPIQERVEFEAGRLTKLPRDISIQVFYRDIESTEPLERLLDKESVHFQGEAEVEAELNFWQSIAAMRRTMLGRVKIDRESKVDVPGGPLAREAARQTLRLAGPLLGTARKGAETVGIVVNPAAPSRETGREHEPALVRIQTQVRLTKAGQNPLIRNYFGAGVMVSPSAFVTSKEVVRPWEFDPELAAILAIDGWKLESPNAEVIVWRAGDARGGSDDQPAGGARLSNGGLRILRLPAPLMERVVVSSGGKKKRVNLHKRICKENLALFEFGAAPQPLVNPRFASASDQFDPAGEKLTLVRWDASSTRISMVEVKARRDGIHILLLQPVDRGSIGAMIVMQSGMLAVVQDETHAILLRKSLPELGFSLAQGETNRPDQNKQGGF